MLGCNLHCSYCQNWQLSQKLRDSHAAGQPIVIEPEEVVQHAMRLGAKVVGSALNEPLITAEWSVEIFKRARASGLHCSYVSSGNATEEVLDFIRPVVALLKIDLKSMSRANYRSLGATRDNVLETIQQAHAKGFWLEVVTLLIPEWNSSDSEIRDIARFLASVSEEIPLHLWRFRRNYRMMDANEVDVSLLVRAGNIARNEGLHYVYAGVMPGLLGDLEHTLCPSCAALLVQRVGYQVTKYRITADGRCPSCGKKIPGLWTRRPDEVRTGPPGLWFERRGRAVV
jgi:pyruvate formate lyase activating enzyme